MTPEPSTPLYFCPYCYVPRGWIQYWIRNDHIKRNHPRAQYPRGKRELWSTPCGEGTEEWYLRYFPSYLGSEAEPALPTCVCPAGNAPPVEHQLYCPVCNP